MRTAFEAASSDSSHFPGILLVIVSSLQPEQLKNWHDLQWVQTREEIGEIGAPDALEYNWAIFGQSFAWDWRWTRKHVSKDGRVSYEEVSMNVEQSMILHLPPVLVSSSNT